MLTNGTKIWGGGPFRMNPPTSLLEVEELEAIEVIKGPYSVTRGPSSIGGTINLVTKQSELSAAWYADGSLGSLYTSNSNLDDQFPCPHGPCNLRGFRNIDHAALIGLDLGLSYAVRKDLTLSAAVAYVHAENEADNTALPEIPPLEGRLGVRYEHADWGVWLHPTVRLVQSQHRIDSAFGENTTPGFVTADLSAGWRFLGRHELTVNVVNLFDTNYYEHMTRENPFSGREVFEPGRVVTVGIRIGV